MESADVDLGYDEETTACDRCGDTDAEAFSFGRLGRKADGTWGVVETYTQDLCYRCATRSGRWA